MIAVTVLHLVEVGVLDLHVPVGRWLSRAPTVIGQVTLHHLLTHTAGLGHWRDIPAIDLGNPPERQKLLRIVLEMTPPHLVGEWSYSNFGYLLAAITIEQATGTAYAQAAQEAVFAPAGMTDTTSGIFPIGDVECAVGHRNALPLTISPTPTTIPGTGDLWTTTVDLMRLSRALYEGRLLEQNHVDAMTSALVPLPAETVIADRRIVATGYGYGTWSGTIDGEPAVICPGDNVGYRSLLTHSRHTSTDIAILTNDDGPTLELPLDAALALSDRVKWRQTP